MNDIDKMIDKIDSITKYIPYIFVAYVIARIIF